MAEFGTKVIDKLIHDACLDRRPDPRSLEVSENPLMFATEHVTDFFWD